jgi:hypothetical protein
MDGTWEELADTFERAPSRRLVAVGPAGQGKSVLCLHLARQLLDRRAPGGPVPVVLPLSGWDPARTSLDEWIERRLPVDVAPALADDAGDGRSVARALVEDRHLIPLLDGLDELPEPARPLAVSRINDAGLGPLFLTSRREEFVRATAHDRVTAAAVVKVRAPALDEVEAWLEETAAPGRTRWRELLEEGAPELADVLRTPLMAGLARAVYSESDADPEKLVAASRSGAGSVETHLLGQLIPAAYRVGAGKRPWGVDTARRYLVTLGRGLADRGIERLEWWRLDSAVPKWRLRLSKATVVGLFSYLCLAGTEVAFLNGPQLRNDLQQALFLAVAVLAGEPGARDRGPVAQQWGRPVHLRRALRAARRPLSRGALVGAAVGIGATAWMLHKVSMPVSLTVVLVAAALAVPAFVLVGLGVTLTVVAPRVMIDLVSRSLPVDRVPSPAALLRQDRRWSLARAAVFGGAVGLLLPSGLQLAFLGVWHLLLLLARRLSSEIAPPPPFSPVFAPTAVLPTAVVVGVAYLLTATAWGRFAYARAYLAVTRRAPWRLMAFLADARDRGVLRQVGAAYAFRHERLQTHLVAADHAPRQPVGAAVGAQARDVT